MAESETKNRYILLISLDADDVPHFDIEYKDLIIDLHKVAPLKRARTLGAVQKLNLADNPPRAILVTDAILAHHYEFYAYQEILNYVHSGGKLIFMGSFASSMRSANLSCLFFVSGLKWMPNHRQREIVYRNNNNCEISSIYRNDKIQELSRIDELPESYHTRAAMLMTRRHEAWYSAAQRTTAETGRTDVTRSGKPPVLDHLRCAVASADVGDGTIGYVGDMEPTKMSNSIVLLMVDPSS